jgi:pyruvate dehydrogenase E2 component (dihydrolipoamide acetyltransferase)
LPVGEIIGYILEEGEEAPIGTRIIDSGLSGGKDIQRTMEHSIERYEEKGQAKSILSSRPPSSPAARRVAAELGMDWKRAKSTGLRGQIKARDVRRLADSLAESKRGMTLSSSALQEVDITPVARQIADYYGVEIGLIAEQERGKRIEKTEVENFIREAISSFQNGIQGKDNKKQPSSERKPMSAVRRRIAARMSQSSHTTAPVTLTTEVDATELVHMREGRKNHDHNDNIPSYSALFAKVAAIALIDHPEMNTSLDGQEIIYWNTVNIGIAVDTENGLFVPVVREVERKDINVLTLEIKDLSERARRGALNPDDLTNGTFTISNLGEYDIDAFTPIINPPECSILGVGRLINRCVVVQGEHRNRTMLTFSLTFDHRLVDGAPAARFLKGIKDLIEKPRMIFA